MTSALAKIERRKKARREVEELSKKESHVLIVHYSCESFYDRENGQTPRITSIAARNFSSGQTASFSIHKVAELSGCPPAEIEARYDDLEKKMLGEFFEYLEAHLSYDWVHWNMRDINYGFPAIEHRFKVLKGKPKVSLDESRKHDLSRIIVALYGPGYIAHPRMKKLMEKNGIKALDFLDGAGEAAAFENKEFVKLHQSTLRKVDVISNIFGRVIDGTLKTDANWRDQYGIHPVVLIELAVKHWIFSLICLAVGIIPLVLPVLQPVNQPQAPKSSSSPADQKSADRRDAKAIQLLQ
jgi:hypothetical protein